MNKKILVTGTGRSGTTFLMRLFTYLNMKTGIKIKEIDKSIDPSCNSGIELGYTDKIDIVKNIAATRGLDFFCKEFDIEYVIVPIRDYEEAAKSREFFKNSSGGLLWGATDYKSQMTEYYKSIAILVKDIVKHDLKTTFLDFEKMTKNKEYLYKKLEHILPNIDFDSFCKSYDLATAKSTKSSGKWKNKESK